MTAWNAGPINWNFADHANNVVQISTNSVDPVRPLYWWRNETPGETFREVCLDFAGQFDYRAHGINVAACVAQEWSPDGRLLIQERELGLIQGESVIFGGE